MFSQAQNSSQKKKKPFQRCSEKAFPVWVKKVNSGHLPVSGTATTTAKKAAAKSDGMAGKMFHP
jgi:hypothetical protein